MRTRLPVAAIAASLLTVCAATSADAAVTYTTTSSSNVGNLPAVDPGTNTIYSIVDVTDASGNETISLISTDGRTLRRKASLALATGNPSQDLYLYFFPTDLKVNARTHTVWLSGGAGRGGGFVDEIDGTTMKLIRSFQSDDVIDSTPGQMAIDPATNTAYIAQGKDGTEPGDWEPVLVALNGSTGATTAVTLPGDYPEIFYDAGNVAFDSANGGVYVAFDGREFAYSRTSLKLASTLVLPAETNSSPRITADGTTHTIYLVGGSTLYKVAGSTNTVTSTTASGSSGPTVPVIDSSIRTVYVGARVFSKTSLAQTGTLPRAATSVNGSTHAIYSPGAVISRRA